MSSYTAESCLIWSKMRTYQKKKEITEKTITEMLLNCKKPYVAFSCGKDSSVLADMVLSQDPSVPLRFISSAETRLLHNVDDVISYFIQKYNANVDEIHFDRMWTEEWKNATFDEQRKAGRRDIQTIDNSAYNGVFMGLRIDESRGRSISLKKCQTTGLPKNMYHYVGREFFRMCPLASWKTEDVGAYIVENNIPVLKWYEAYGFEARTTARLTGDSIRQNALFFIKATNPEAYAKLTARFPELSVIA